MIIDRYTKTILTLITFALIFSLIKPLMTPFDAQATNNAKFAHLQVSASASGIVFFDTRTGELWIYQPNKSPKKRTISELGKPWTPQN